MHHYICSYQTKYFVFLPQLHQSSRRYHRSQGTENHRWHRSRHRSGSMQKCRPVHFNIRSGRKYLFYVKKVSAGRYVSVAIPDQLNRKSRKASKKLLCSNCGKNKRILNLNVFEYYLN